MQFDGVLRPYAAAKNNLSQFYNTGSTLTNTLAFSKSFEGGAVRFSASDLHNNAVIPNSGMNRQSFNLSSNFNLAKRLTLDTRGNYILENVSNRPILSDSPGNSSFTANLLPNSLDISLLEPGTNPDGSEKMFGSWPFVNNPYFVTNNFRSNSIRNRFLGSTSLRYDFDNGLFVQARAGTDSYTDRFTNVVPTGTGYRPDGQMTDQTRKFSELNADILIGKEFKAGNLRISPNVGGNLMHQEVESTNLFGSRFAIPFVYAINNAKDKNVNYTNFRQEIQSLYGTVEFDYKALLYLTATGRNDWFSTLAPNSNLDVFYPSLSGSFVFSELMNNNWLSFGKLRAGYAIVGQGTLPYQTRLFYNVSSATINGKPLGNIINSSIPSSTLMPSTASELEFGTELRVFKNRLSLDLAWYSKKSKDEIIQAPISIGTGYSSVILNIGEVQNKGVELLLSGTPVKTQNFIWTSSVNGSYNANKVLSLAAGQGSFSIQQSRSLNAYLQNIVGKPVNQIVAFDYKYDANGGIVKDANGIPVRGGLKSFGSGFAPWTAGWSNEFSYKNLNFSFLLDSKFGGHLLSSTNYFAYVYGLHKGTLAEREKSFGPNNLSSQIYYNTMANNVGALYVQDADFIKLRQVSISHSFPAKAFNGFIQGATLSLVGRNLLTLHRKTDNVDPEAAFNSTAQGLEAGGVPPVRTFGLNLNVKF
jgi:outer membrane receptor protein involved in Fe transport